MSANCLRLLLVGLLLALCPVSAQVPHLGKRGTCPTYLEDAYMMRGQFCSSDASCPGNELCCKTKYGQQCDRPIEDSSGYCPKASPSGGDDHLSICLVNCTTDATCGVNINLPGQKCCQAGCQWQCAKAEEEHPGVCPKKNVVFTKLPCTDTCTDDRDCPLSQKCCFNGCSRGCLDSVRSDQCQYPAEYGACRARKSRYFYDPLQKKCILFIYSGCKGNTNNFETQEACERACGKISTEVCKLPMDPGMCLGYTEFYYHNSVTKTCEKFVYGLCGGNGNRFSTKLECMMVCGEPEVSAGK